MFRSGFVELYFLLLFGYVLFYRSFMRDNFEAPINKSVQFVSLRHYQIDTLLKRKLTLLYLFIK
jgi:hypothetical protein